MRSSAPGRPNRKTLQYFEATSEYFSKIKGMARKKRLFASACIRLIPEELLTPLVREALTWSERHADGRTDEKTRRKLLKQNEKVLDADDGDSSTYLLNEMIELFLAKQTNEPVYAVAIAAVAPLQLEKKPSAAFRKIHNRNAETDRQLKLFDDIFGIIFKSTVIDPRWLSSTVLDLANQIYNDRQFERLPILADALMDAGCDSDEIIDHCRGPGPHTRGCWVVDLLTGRG